MASTATRSSVTLEPRVMPELFHDLQELLACPVTGRPLDVADGELLVPGTDRRYVVDDGIPDLFVPNTVSEPRTDVTPTVGAFYEETPFPDYDEFDSRESLMTKGRRSVFAARLDEQIPDDAVVLEAGCGTGQMTNFLGMSWRRRVFGADLSMNSLRLAEAFRNRYSIRNAAFLRMNLFHPPFRDQSFDLIITNGVLHHTGDPRGGFAALVKKLKVGGIISVGLYNSYARLPTLWRAALFRRFGESLHFLESRLRTNAEGKRRLRAWYFDQYLHPHESKHSMDEVLGWFDAHGIEFLSGTPSPDGSKSTAETQVFQPHSPGTRFDRVMTQLGMLLNGGKDGGLFVMIGRRYA